MPAQTLVKLSTVEVPLDRVWAFISTPVHLQQWWQANSLRLEMRSGGAYFQTGAIKGVPYCYTGAVITVQPPQKLIFSLRMELPVTWPPDVFSQVSITLHPRVGYTNHADTTLVTLEHSGFDALPPEYQCLTCNFEPIWAAIMLRLAEAIAASETSES